MFKLPAMKSCLGYQFKFQDDISPPTHPCALRVMEAQIPSHYVDEYVSKDITILVVGQTSAGKSTQIDGILNYLLAIKFGEKVRFKVVNENETVTQASLKAGAAASQTDMVTAYKIPAIKGGPVKSNLTIIDTPGFGDTRGLHFDTKIVDQMKQFFREFGQHVACLTGVCFVTQASAARLTESQQYVWDAILGLFGKDIEQNIAVCFTFADGEKPQALEAVRSGGIPMTTCCKFNNSALFVEPTQQSDALSKMFWDMGKKSMADFFHALLAFTPKSLHLTKQVMDEREHLEATLESLGPQVQLVLSTANSLQQSEQLAAFDDTMKSTKDFTTTIQVPKFRKKPVRAGQNTTTCTTCDRTCHENCVYANDSSKSQCCVMSNGYCTACPRKCHWSKHQNLPYILEWYSETQKQTLDELKAKYDSANEGKANVQKILQGILDELVRNHKLLADLLVRTKKCKERLAEIAMRPSVLPSEEYIQIMIENEKSNQKPGWQNRVPVLEKLKKNSALLKNAEDPQFTERLLKDFREDEKTKVAVSTVTTWFSKQSWWRGG
ncbi:unnamed protein product [Effrenium voratum]|nr:unnamed protein product [Effrenium voratum]